METRKDSPDSPQCSPSSSPTISRRSKARNIEILIEGNLKEYPLAYVCAFFPLVTMISALDKKREFKWNLENGVFQLGIEYIAILFGIDHPPTFEKKVFYSIEIHSLMRKFFEAIELRDDEIQDQIECLKLDLNYNFGFDVYVAPKFPFEIRLIKEFYKEYTEGKKGNWRKLLELREFEQKNLEGLFEIVRSRLR